MRSSKVWVVRGLILLGATLSSEVRAQSCPAANSCASSGTAYSWTNGGFGGWGGAAIFNGYPGTGPSVVTIGGASVTNTKNLTVSATSDSRGIVASSTGAGTAVIANSTSSGHAIFAQTPVAHMGLVASSTSNNGIQGEASVGGVSGVYGSNHAVNGFGVAGRNIPSFSGSGAAIYGDTGNATSGSWAGYFNGRVFVAGMLSKPGGGFLIDDPVDPTNKHLVHSFVESPDMKNFYDGTTVLDQSGKATVTMPDWFQALNTDFRYLLTCIGGYAPVYVNKELAKNQFEIAGGVPGLKISWQVTGTRHDPYASKFRLPVAVDKPESERGRYLHPEAYGLPSSMGLKIPARGLPLGRSSN